MDEQETVIVQLQGDPEEMEYIQVSYIDNKDHHLFSGHFVGDLSWKDSRVYSLKKSLNIPLTYKKKWLHWGLYKKGMKVNEAADDS